MEGLFPSYKPGLGLSTVH